MRAGRSLVAHVRSGDSYALVLGLLLASLFFGTVAPEETWARVLRDAVLAGTVVVAYWTATARFSPVATTARPVSVSTSAS